MNLYNQEDIATIKAKIYGSNIFLKWIWMNNTVPQYVKETVVFYMQEGDSKVVILQRYKNSLKTECIMQNALRDANYNICIKAIMNESWPGVRESTFCTRVTNNKSEIYAFIGSTAGALFALVLIMLLILMSKRFKKRQKKSKTNINQNLQRQRYDSAFESQFDSVAIREDTSFYDELITSDISYFESSFKVSAENNLSSTIIPSVSNICENSNIKSVKKRASLIEEEYTGNQSCDGWMHTITPRQNNHTYQNIKESMTFNQSSSSLVTENRDHVMETCIDETDISNIPNSLNIESTDLSQKTDLNISL